MALRWWRLLLALLVAVLVAAACTPEVAEPEWSGFDKLPADFRGETLTVVDDRLFIGGGSIEPARPTLLVAESGAVREIPLRPESGYGETATLTSVAVSGDQIVAIGGDRGGAHANVRWSTWSGTLDEVVEHEQTFWTFGGQDAGALTAIVSSSDGPMIIGNWGSRYGLDITVWTVRNDLWTRHDSRGSVLGSTARELISERAAAVIDDGVIIAGKALDLNGLVPQAAAWTQQPDGGWQRSDLPATGTKSGALDLDCGDDCLIAGVIDGRLAAWTGDGTGWQEVDLPEIEADEESVTLRVFRTDAGWRVAVGDQDQVTVLDPDSGRTSTGPSGKLIDAAGVGTTAYLLVEAADGTRTLWQAN